MALVKCLECGKEISDKAKACPQCGWKVNVDKIKKEMKQEDVKKEEVLPKKSIEIEVSCFEPDAYKSVLSNEMKIQEQAKENQGTRTDLTSSPNGEKVKSTHTDKELAEVAGVGIVVENDTIMKSDSVEVDDIKKDNKKGKIFKKIVIAVVVLIALGAWSVVLVKMTVQSVIKEVNFELASMDDIEIISIEESSTSEITTVVEQEVEAEVISSITEGVDDSEQMTQEVELSEESTEDMDVSIAEDEILEVSFDAYTGGTYPDLVYTVKNLSDEDIEIKVDRYQYINGVAVVNYGTIEYTSIIPAGKGTIVKFPFQRSDLDISFISDVELYCSVYGDSGEAIEKSYAFNNLKIAY